MKNPFIFGEEVSGDSFWNRDKELKILVQEIVNGQNVIIFSPRRYGKTSLIRTAIEKARKKDILCVYVDLFPANTKEKFIEVFARAVSESLGKPTEKLLNVIKSLFPSLIPRFVVDTEGNAEFQFEFSKKGSSRINLPKLLNTVHEKAKKDKKDACVVFDEFQEIAKYVDDEIEREMRTAFQRHKNVCYIFMGSKKHLFTELFQDPNRPFYRSGRHMPLEKLPLKEVEKYVERQFSKGKIRSNKNILSEIAMRGEGHPYYTQLLCHNLWEECIDKKSISEKDVKTAFENTLKWEKPAYQSILDGLTPNQKDLLMALSRESSGQIYSQEFRSKHDLGSHSSVQRSVRSLIKKDVIHQEGKDFVFHDPFFSMWLKRNL